MIETLTFLAIQISLVVYLLVAAFPAGKITTQAGLEKGISCSSGRARKKTKPEMDEIKTAVQAVVC